MEKTNKLKVTIKKIIWKINSGYKPKEFWDNWAKTFMDDSWQVDIHPEHNWLLKNIKKEFPKTILEVGCGFGRNIKFLLDKGIESNITGIDISPEMIKKAKGYIGTKDVNLYVGNIENLPFKNKTFDLVLTHGVLMHVPPKNITKAIEELFRIAKKTVILIEQNYGGNEYTFIHNYKKILNEHNFHTLEFKKDKKIGLDLIIAKL